MFRNTTKGLGTRQIIWNDLGKGTTAGKRPLGRPRRRWEANIRMDLKEIDINTTNWVDLAQDRDYWRALVNEALNFQAP